jgi:DNA-binding NarL/FixJ family response regulator
MNITRIVLADDHAGVRAYVRRLLQRTPGIEVIGEASNGNEALQLVNQLQPDVLLLDMEMPVLSGVEVARRLRAENSPVRVLALSAYDDRQYVLEMLSNGAAGYLTKDDAPDFIVEAVRSVAEGEGRWVSEQVAAKIAPYLPNWLKDSFKTSKH